MLSLSIVAACIIGCNYAICCPWGTTGGTTGPGGTTKLITPFAVYGPSTYPYERINIDTCHARCASFDPYFCRGYNGNFCVAIGYSDREDRCVLYESVTPGSYESVTPGSYDIRTPPDQILCHVSPTLSHMLWPALSICSSHTHEGNPGGSVTCPYGTQQIPGARSGTQACQVFSGVTDIGACQTRCDSACSGSPCQAFGYSDWNDRCYTYQSAAPGGSYVMLGSSGAIPIPPDQILCAVTAGEPTSPTTSPTTAAPTVPRPQCPSGTTQVDGPHSGLSPCSGPATINSIEGCEDYCNAKNPIGVCCQLFSFSAATDKCVAYRDYPVPTWGSRRYIYGPDQILCRPDVECPAGTRASQRGEICAYSRSQNDPQVPVLKNLHIDIEECRDNCDRHSTCGAFAFEAGSCRGFNAVTCRWQGQRGTRIHKINPGAILCVSQSPGLFSVDRMVGYSNGNGQVYVQIPAYVVYGIVALILVNIVCLMVHCWNKSKGNSKEYKTVSMRSDIDEETDIN